MYPPSLQLSSQRRQLRRRRAPEVWLLSCGCMSVAKVCHIRDGQPYQNLLLILEIWYVGERAYQRYRLSQSGKPCSNTDTCPKVATCRRAGGSVIEQSAGSGYQLEPYRSIGVSASTETSWRAQAWAQDHITAPPITCGMT